MQKKTHAQAQAVQTAKDCSYASGEGLRVAAGGMCSIDVKPTERKQSDNCQSLTRPRAAGTEGRTLKPGKGRPKMASQSVCMQRHGKLVGCQGDVQYSNNFSLWAQIPKVWAKGGYSINQHEHVNTNKYKPQRPGMHRVPIGKDGNNGTVSTWRTLKCGVGPSLRKLR